MINRKTRNSLRRTVAALLVLAVTAGAPALAAAAPPNIVLILADDLGWTDTGVYGSTYYQTPHIDALASQGMRFTDAYAANPLCSPTRASIMTGQHPARIGMTAAQGHVDQVALAAEPGEGASPVDRAVTPKSATRLATDYYTLAEALRDAGYRTAHFGKWHLGGGPYDASEQGFAVTLGGGGDPAPRSYFSPYRMDSVPDGPPGEHIDAAMTTAAIDFLREHRGAPFFLNLWYYSVHGPFQAEPALVQKYTQLRDPGNRHNDPVMAAMIETLDQSVGRLLDALDTLGLVDNTVVIFASDNGGLAQPHNGYTEHAPTSNAPLRAGKGSSYEGGTRIPLLIRWPAGIAPGQVSGVPVSTLDLYPTLLALAGVAPAPGLQLDGTNLAGLLTRGEAPPAQPIFGFFPHYLHNPRTVEPSVTVRYGSSKLLRFFARGPDGTDAVELYDLATDIGEERNLAEQQPERVAALQRMIDDFLTATNAVTPTPNPAFNAGARQYRHDNAYLHLLPAPNPSLQLWRSFPFALNGGCVEIVLSAPAGGIIKWHAPGLLGPGHRTRFSVERFDAAHRLCARPEADMAQVQAVKIELRGADGVSFERLRLLDPNGESLFSFDIPPAGGP